MISKSVRILITKSQSAVNVGFTWINFSSADALIRTIVGKRGELRVSEVTADFEPGASPILIRDMAIFSKIDWLRVFPNNNG